MQQKKIINVTAEINRTKNRQNTEKISGTKSWFFEKINKVDKIANSRMKEEAQSLNYRIKRIIHQICEEIYAKKDGLDGMNTLLEGHQFVSYWRKDRKYIKNQN